MRPRTLVIFFLLALVLELGVRFAWDKSQGTPGLVLGHPTRVEILASDYTGYFAGKPLRVNRLGFRDDREYTLAKDDKTFRIFILGDSVGFGHGVKFSETWGFFLEERLKKWRPDIHWEVWNLSVPGYDPTLKFRALEDYGPRAHPDLVIYSWYKHDVDGRDYAETSDESIWKFRARWFFKKNVYLYSQLKVWRDNMIIAKYPDFVPPERREAELLAAYEEKDPVFEPEKFVLKHRLAGAPRAPAVAHPFAATNADFKFTDRTIQRLKALNQSDQYPLLFFINGSPEIDQTEDQFVSKDDLAMDRFFQSYLGSGGTPMVSSYDAFLAYRPSEVPGTLGHAKAPANFVKADVLFKYMSETPQVFRKFKDFAKTSTSEHQSP